MVTSPNMYSAESKLQSDPERGESTMSLGSSV
eukprot:CAMPEP_0177589322 /NCGR_PEP_ID=MMETSP0419_2-20121207/6738_1 /TAXON_ID=582737 /ORGANISM="Tetraselmis sp., Strain GSL018" /LENGTH=31 /DNA_ID= /DNA_START= /DNA_END= /DNA_ORIENTATION=